MIPSVLSIYERDVIGLIDSIESYVRRFSRTVRVWAAQEQVRQAVGWTMRILTGFVLSAAGIRSRPLPLVLALCCTQEGWYAAAPALGGILGYPILWGSAGLQGAVWSILGLAVSAGKRQRSPGALLPALAALATAVCGLAFQYFLNDTTPVPLYILRVLLAAGAAAVFRKASADPIARWLAMSFFVLGLAQLAPIPYLGLGFVAAGAISASCPFPAAALAGLALDLAGVAAVPMAAVTCLSWFPRLLSEKKRFVWFFPAAVYVAVMGFTGVWDLRPLPGLILGGLLPVPRSSPHRRGETGVIQVRLELAAGAMTQTRLLLQQVPLPPIDREAAAKKAVERACGGCPCRKTCHVREEAVSPSLLDAVDTLPFSCKKQGRMLLELRRAQEQLARQRSEQAVRQECLDAVTQQYRFLSEYLRDLSDDLSRRIARPRFEAEVSVYANRPEAENGDRCCHFSGIAGKYYVLLCDGMGTGPDAVREGDTAQTLLQKLLAAGLSAQSALRSLSSLCALRNLPGASTVDLTELDLAAGSAVLYKWGARPSLLLTQAGAEKIGTAGPPPGLSVTDTVGSVERLSLRRGETLLMLSDGVGGEDAQVRPGEAPGELARRLLDGKDEAKSDDATVVTIRLRSASQVT